MHDPEFGQYADKRMPYAAPAPPQTSTLAIVSLVSGILGLTAFPGIGSIVAIITGHLAKGEIDRSQGTIGGKGLAIAGLILGYLMVALAIIGALLFLAFIFLAVGLASRAQIDIDPPTAEVIQGSMEEAMAGMTTDANIEPRVKKIVAELTNRPAESMTSTTTLESMGIDDSDRDELVMDLEDAFSLEISDDEAKALRTIGDIVELIKKKRPAPGAHDHGHGTEIEAKTTTEPPAP